MQNTMNVRETSGGSVTKRLPVRYELIGQDGRCYGSYATAQLAAKFAHTFWPDQSQDEDRKGLGWDIQVAGLA